MNLDGFNAAEVEVSNTFEPLPVGWYSAMITESEEKQTRAGTGSYLALTFQVLDGPFKGRLLWANLNLNNPNERAVQIARRDLAAICQAVGVMAPKRSEELHHKPLAIRVSQREWNGDMKNEIKGYKASADNAPKHTPPSAPQQAAASTPPWARKAG